MCVTCAAGSNSGSLESLTSALPCISYYKQNKLYRLVYDDSRQLEWLEFLSFCSSAVHCTKVRSEYVTTLLYENALQFFYNLILVLLRVAVKYDDVPCISDWDLNLHS